MMSCLFFTSNILNTTTSAITDAEKIAAITMSTWVGQEDVATFRIGYTGATATVALVYRTNPNLSLSFDSVRDFQQTLDYDLQPGAVGETVYVKLTAPFDHEEGQQQDVILVSVDGQTFTLTVDFFIAESNKGFTSTPTVERYFGENTLSHIEQFETNGEVISFEEWEPLAKPLFGNLIPPFRQKDFRSVKEIQEWCNPFNRQVGFELAIQHQALCFIGSRNIASNLKYEHNDLDIAHEDTNKIAIIPTAEFWQPTPWKKRVRMHDLIAAVPTFQFTVWTISRANKRFALSNLVPQFFYNGEFIYWTADLIAVNYPGTANTESFLPWNELFDADQKRVDYVRGYSDQPVGENLIDACFDDTSCGALPDPYVDDPYCAQHNPFADLETLVYFNQVVFWRLPWWENRKAGQNFITPLEQEPAEFDVGDSCQ